MCKGHMKVNFIFLEKINIISCCIILQYLLVKNNKNKLIITFLENNNKYR